MARRRLLVLDVEAAKTTAKRGTGQRGEGERGESSASHGGGH
jgi:hypothetical protein